MTTAAPSPPRVQVGIVSWNTGALLARCLEALPAALAGLDARVVVVDNDSTDDSAARARAAGATVVVNPTNVGYARAMNQALAGDADVLIACNPDAEPPPGSLRALVDTLLAEPRRALVAPRLLDADGSLQHSVHRFPTPATSLALAVVPGRIRAGALGRRLWLDGAVDHRRCEPIDWAIGAVHVLRADALGGAAPYDERWFMYVEDLDLCWRLRQAGLEVVLDGRVAVPHVGNAAGAVAWGEGRTARWQWATYDWVQLRRGSGPRRAYAAANLLATLALMARPWLAAPVSAPARALGRRRWRAHRASVRLHASALVRGPGGREAEWGPPEAVRPGRSGR